MIFPLLIGKLIIFTARKLKLGYGGTWPGEVAIQFQNDILKKFFNRVRKGIIIVSGTNGKTTTSSMIYQVISQMEGEDAGQIITNPSGANLENGLVSAFIEKTDIFGRKQIDWAILETDEGIIPKVLTILSIVSCHKVIVLLNLFRDQLDRYGEVDLIAAKWNKAIISLPKDSTLVLNADDPQIAYLGKDKKLKTMFFGIDNPKFFQKIKEHATDSTYCLVCGKKLKYKGIYFSHLGIWACLACGWKRQKPNLADFPNPLTGLYNQYNTNSAVLACQALGFREEDIKKAIESFTPAFGRQEEFIFNGHNIKIFLAKNPAGFNASLRTVLSFKPKTILFVLNDRIPDGRDVSWIWDADFEHISKKTKVVVSGDRTYDLGLRVKYADKTQKLMVEKNLKKAINLSLSSLGKQDILYILPTYSAMLEVRKILTGRKIL